MKQSLIIFLTHNFLPNFIRQLKIIDKKYDDRDIIILYDNDNEKKLTAEELTKVYFKNIQIIQINKTKSSYDDKGHILYLSYFKKFPSKLLEYKYYWIIENDVHFHCGIDFFINKHEIYNYDVLITENGVRDVNWCHTNSLSGFSHNYNIGVLAVIIRFSCEFLKNLIKNIDKNYYGYIEAIIPHICKKYNFSINTFLPELIGIMNIYGGPLIGKIKDDILNDTNNFIEGKIYHPIKI